MVQSKLIPKSVTVLREGYSGRQLLDDSLAGLIVGIVALPLAIASGVKPEQGLYTAIVAGFLISALSGSRVQIGGPTGRSSSSSTGSSRSTATTASPPPPSWPAGCWC